jgi:hypothetical protein
VSGVRFKERGEGILCSIIRHENENERETFPLYFNGMKREEFVDPIPGRPCLTGL